MESKGRDREGGKNLLEMRKQMHSAPTLTKITEFQDLRVRQGFRNERSDPGSSESPRA
jgi:hypothetical protein